MSDKKNILFIQCDSMDGRIMGCMGHAAAYTPNIDKLAASGVLFRNAYSNCPVCCPSRASMRSGQYIHHCEAWNNYKGLSGEDPTFVTQLNAHGINTPEYGKLDYLCGGHTIRNGVAAWTRSANIRRSIHKERKPIILHNDIERVHAGFWSEAVDPCREWLLQQAQDNSPFVLYYFYK